MSRYIHDKTTHELIPVSGFGSRVATSVNGNTLKVHGSLLDIEGYNYGEGDITTAVQMIAPIESTLVASKAYAIGDQFVYEGLLYKATAAIASGGSIVIGTNCTLADCVTKQIQNMTVKTYTRSGQTTASGNFVTPFDLTNKIPLSVLVTTSGENVIGLIGTTPENMLVVRVLNLGGEVLASTQINLTFYYV